MTDLPAVYRRHLEAVTGGGVHLLREVWERDGVLDFPYAVSLGATSRLEGIEAIVAYFEQLTLFGAFTFSGARAARTSAEDWVAELHGSSTVLATGAPYEQDYVVRFGLSPRGRLVWMREYWDPTRATA